MTPAEFDISAKARLITGGGRGISKGSARVVEEAGTPGGLSLGWPR